jgi:FkbM family methyltransferase
MNEFGLVQQYFKGRDPGLFVDVGAHEGGIAAMFASLGWRILAFEPEKQNRESFLLKHASNQHVECIPKAVSDTSGDKIPFYTSEVHYGIHSIRPFHDTHQKASYEVETIALKDALEEHNINHVTFLKVDTEGADFLALKGFDWDRITPEIVMVEFMDHRSEKNFGYTHHDMARYMMDRGYACFVSEWAPIKQYGIKGQKGEPHQWLQCVPYPLDHEPSWGNLIFVPKGNEQIFERTLRKYLKSLKRGKKAKFRLRYFVLMARNLVRKYLFK